MIGEPTPMRSNEEDEVGGMKGEGRRMKEEGGEKKEESEVGRG
jgi:hypothetical protein